MDPAGNSSEEAAKARPAFNDSKRNYKKKQLSGQTTDSGGGGTDVSKQNYANWVSITNEEYYFTPNCTLHSLAFLAVLPYPWRKFLSLSVD